MDVAIAIAGAVVLVVAITGSALYGGTGSGGGSTFSLTFPTSTADIDGKSEQVAGSAEVEFTFDVATQNLTSVSFTASAAAPGGASPTAPQVTITAVAPDGTEFTGQGSSVEASMGAAPERQTVTAASEDAVETPAPRTNGTGTWTVHVQVTSLAPVPVPYTVTVTGTATSYEAKVERLAPEASR